MKIFSGFQPDSTRLYPSGPARREAPVEKPQINFGGFYQGQNDEFVSRPLGDEGKSGHAKSILGGLFF